MRAGLLFTGTLWRMTQTRNVLKEIKSSLKESTSLFVFLNYGTESEMIIAKIKLYKAYR